MTVLLSINQGTLAHRCYQIRAPAEQRPTPLAVTGRHVVPLPDDCDEVVHRHVGRILTSRRALPPLDQARVVPKLALDKPDVPGRVVKLPQDGELDRARGVFGGGVTGVIVAEQVTAQLMVAFVHHAEMIAELIATSGEAR